MWWGPAQTRHRKASIRDLDRQSRVLLLDIDVEKFLCRDCGSVVSKAAVDMEPGFRFSKPAADFLVDTALEKGVVLTAREHDVDGGTISRLLSARSQAVVSNTPLMGMVGIRLLRPSLVEACDYMSGRALVYFSGKADAQLKTALSRPREICLVPDVELLPVISQMVGPSQLMISQPVFLTFLNGLFPRVARRMAKVVSDKSLDRTIAENIFARDVSDYSEKERVAYRELISKENKACRFFELKAQIKSVFETHNVKIARLRLESWLKICTGVWADVFEPIIVFIEKWNLSLLKHPLSLVTPSFARDLTHSMPANILNLRLHNAAEKLRKLTKGSIFDRQYKLPYQNGLSLRT